MIKVSKRLYWRYKVNENTSQLKHIFGKIELTHEWRNFQSEQKTLESYKRNPLEPKIGIIDEEVYEVDTGKVINSTIPIYKVQKIFNHSDLILMSRDQLVDIAIEYRLVHKFSSKEMLLDKILNFQKNHIDSEGYVLGHDGKRLENNLETNIEENGNKKDTGEISQE